MITLNFDVNKQIMTRTDNNAIASNSHLKHECVFDFSAEWDGMEKVASFKKKNMVYSVMLENDSCLVPTEVLKSSAKTDEFEVSVYGTDTESTLTSSIVAVPTIGGAWNTLPAEVTPTMFEQIMKKIDEVKKGEVEPELIYEAVSEWIAQHPFEPIIAEDVADYFVAHHDEFKGDKGDKGDRGLTGLTPEITATAEVGASVGTPSVTVQRTGTDENPNLHFNFQNMKGVKGDKGNTGATPNVTATAEVGATVGTPSVSVTKTGTAENPALHFNFQNLKGVKGDKGDKGNTGSKGDTGATGNGITSVVKTATSGLVDTYTITFTNGNTTTFTVSNGLGIKSADINTNGHLIITYSDDTTYDAGALSDVYATAADVDTKLNNVWEAQGEYGVKNLLVYPYPTPSGGYNGVIFTAQSDGSFIANGSATGYSHINPYLQGGVESSWKFLNLKSGEYKMSLYADDYSKITQGYLGVLFRITDRRVTPSVSTEYKIVTNENSNECTITITQEMVNAINAGEMGVETRLFASSAPNAVCNNVTVYLMIRCATDIDDTWQPYAKTNRKLTTDKAEQSQVNDITSVLGAKNLLKYPYKYLSSNIYTNNNITYVMNDDGSITINGNNIAGYSTCHLLRENGLLDNGKEYIASVQGLTSGVQFQIGYIDNDTFINKVNCTSATPSIKFAITNEYDGKKIGIRLVVVPNSVVDNITIYPMIRLASDPDDTWQPYAPTNRELNNRTDIINISNSFYTNLEEGVTLSNVSVWKQGNHIFGDFCAEGVASNVWHDNLFTAIYAPYTFLNTTCAYSNDRYANNYKIGYFEIGTNGIVKTKYYGDEAFSVIKVHLDYICQ